MPESQAPAATLLPPSLNTQFRKRYKKILNVIGKTIEEFRLIEEGDRILVAVSGGKDSICLMLLLEALRRKAPVNFSIFAYTLDQGQPGFDSSALEQFFASRGLEHMVVKQDTYSVVLDKLEPGSTYCSLCSRLRRGILYTEAKRLGATKIALGHHGDDAIETLFLNLLYTGRMASMPPKLFGKGGENIVIRPLIRLDEEDLVFLSESWNLPIIPCNLCGSQDNLQRKRIKDWVNEEKKRNPMVKQSLKSALGKVEPEFLWDNRHSDFHSKEEMPPVI